MAWWEKVLEELWYEYGAFKAQRKEIHDQVKGRVAGDLERKESEKEEEKASSQ